jgi:hypothetical protein
VNAIDNKGIFVEQTALNEYIIHTSVIIEEYDKRAYI